MAKIFDSITDYKVVYHDFPEKEYVKEVSEKTQICLHHTVSGGDGIADINYWMNKPGRIVCPIVIDRDGTIRIVHDPKYWGYHLGQTKKDCKKVGAEYIRQDANCIGIELDSFGYLQERDGVWGSVYGHRIDTPIIPYLDGFRGKYYYEAYTPEQIESLRQVLNILCSHFNIPMEYDATMWDVNKEALEGKNGIWTHVSYRSDKTDCHPQPKLIQMLRGLTEIKKPPYGTAWIAKYFKSKSI